MRKAGDLLDAIIAAIIAGALSLLGTVITVLASSKKTENKLSTEIAVIQADMKNLTKEVEKHNNFASRIPALEVQEKLNEAAIKRLENFHME